VRDGGVRWLVGGYMRCGRSIWITTRRRAQGVIWITTTRKAQREYMDSYEV
jgi:hypothetical protein